MFGRIIEGDREAYWGARAIYDQDGPYVVSLLWDRQSANGIKENDEFHRWINKVALPWLKDEAKKVGLSTDSMEVLKMIDGLFEIEASPQGSYGYLYIGAVKRPEKTDGKDN